MAPTRLTAHEQRLLAEIEDHLRSEAPRLDRRLARPPGLPARVTHRPRLLAAAVALLSVLTAAGALWAAAGPLPGVALLVAAVSAVLGVLALHRLAQVRQD
ncbi:DUF3040 domain-containing protein [Streptomyces sp. TLI_171]|uniref:DUF3040 domain-containing protein n=1 Tax=Streptomyces sp. TLI_171 TaxID=1938859 RepID=UPI000C1A6707|nr:DUF3040 domain-containing protein [Streptomyces sp. TLI_171]RKE17421.1 hypothetical protein BX266_0677 [Streptomyces sp. TLI_171]